jgi:hypothetical protein
MTDFHRTAINDDNFIRGAARLLWAGDDDLVPVFDCGHREPVHVRRRERLARPGRDEDRHHHHGEQHGRDVRRGPDYGDLDSRPTGWECTASTALAEMMLKHLALA